MQALPTTIGAGLRVRARGQEVLAAGSAGPRLLPHAAACLLALSLASLRATSTPIVLEGRRSRIELRSRGPRSPSAVRRPDTGALGRNPAARLPRASPPRSPATTRLHRRCTPLRCGRSRLGGQQAHALRRGRPVV